MSYWRGISTSILFRSVVSSLFVICIAWTLLLLLIYTGVQIDNEAMDPGWRRESVLRIAEQTEGRPFARDSLLMAFDAQQKLGDNELDEDSGQLMMVVRRDNTVIYSSPLLSQILQPAFTGKVEEVFVDGWKWLLLCSKRDSYSVCLQRKRFTFWHIFTPDGRLKKLLTLPLMTLPLIFLSLVPTVWWSMRPIRKKSSLLQKRDLDDIGPLLDGKVPLELRPFVSVIDEWRARIASAREREVLFVANAAHELRTPLAAIQVNTEVVVERQKLQGLKDQNLEGILNGSKRMARVVEQLLSLLRSESNDARHRKMERLNITRLIQDRMAEINTLAEKKQIILSLQYDERVYMYGDQEQLESIVDNLIGNSIKYCPPGSSISVIVKRDGHLVYLRFSDDGPGIDKSERSVVFERFRRLSGSVEPGAGLGMAIVKTAVLRHNGEIELLDGLGGKGLCVDIKLRDEPVIL